ncbi:unnamed protein product [Ixodes hexagonus]
MAHAKGNAAPAAREPIAVRSTKLNHLLLGRGSGQLASRHLASRDSLLDALFALYEECNREQLRRDKNIALFLDKYQSIVTELRHLRVSISDFEMKAVIGRGHFGDIHMVKEKATGDIYAMKILRKDDTLSQREVAFYEEERDILVRAPQGGPWLTQLQYAFQDTSHLYLVMEFMPGGDLFGLLDRSGPALPEDDARFYMAELVLALHALHTLGYIHRDVKPDNVLIDRTGHIKLADFGSAAKLTDRKSTRSRLPVGTPHYVAPEVLSAMGGGPAAMCVHGTGCDWWSLGVVGYEMLFGQNPFADDRITVTYNNIMNFKDSLTFPKEAEVSETAIKMLQGLLTSADQRFSYKDMCNHEFFASVDWNNIRQTVPPFVPSLSGDEDTSNFDEFEHETPRPRVPALKDQKKGFEGSSLPFVGFTHTQCTSSAGLDRTVSFLEVGSPRRESLNAGIGSGARRQLQEQVATLTQREATLTQECQGTQARLREAQEAMARLEKQLAAAEAREADLKADNQNLSMLVNLERQGRLVSEEKAVQLVGALKRKYRRQDELLRSGYFPKVAGRCPEEAEDCVSEEQTDGVGQQGSAPEEDREQLERELQKERARCSKYKEHLNRILEEGKECMEEMQRKHKSNVEYIDGVRKEVTEAVEKQRRAEQALSVCREECSSHREKVAVLEKQLASLKLQKFENSTPVEFWNVKSSKIRLPSNFGVSKVCKFENFRTFRTGCKSELHREAEGLRSVVARLEQVARSQEPAVQRSAMSGSGDNNGPAEKLEALQKKARDLEDANAHYVKEIERLNIVKSSLVPRIIFGGRASLGAEAQPTVSEATAALESQLAKTREFLSTSRTRCGELQFQLRKAKEALSEAQLDARIAKREAKREAKRCEEGELALKGKLAEATQELDALKKAEADLKAKLAELQQALQREERQAAMAKLSYEKELAKLEERVQMLRDNCGTAKNLEAKCTTTADECRDLTVKCKVLELEAQREAEARTRVEHDSQGLEEELKKERAKTDKLIKTLQMLKETCEELDRQVVAYEDKCREAEKKVADFDVERAAHKEAVDKLNRKNALLKESLMLEKAARKRQEEELEEHQAGDREASASLESLRTALSEREALLEEMGSEALFLRRELGAMEASSRALQRREDTLLKENLAIKEEASRHITTIASLKSSNLTLSQELEEWKARHMDTLDYVEQLESEMDGQKSFAETEMVKLNQTLAQQTKLIDFLQTKVAELDKKKKKFFGGGRSGKETVGTMPRTDTDGALERERSKCRRLQDQLDRARAEVMVLRQQPETHLSVSHSSKVVSVPTSPKSRALLTALTMSPSTNMDSRLSEGGESTRTSGGASKGPPLRMQHNIPHRFQVILCMRGTKCAACLDSVHFGRYASRCEECQVVCHPKCSTLVPSTCGVPAEYVRQFSDSVSGQKTSPPAPGRHVKFAPGLFEVTFDQSQPQGWVKLPRSGGKPGWDKCFLVLREDTLYMLNQAVEPGADAGTLESLAHDSIRLCPPDGEALVSSAVSAAELLGTAKTDLPYTFKLELKPLNTCWPSRCLYIMVPTFDEKQMWVSVLEECVGKNLDFASKNTLGDTVLLLEGDQVLDINCTYELSFEHLLLGAMEGLFVVDLVGSGVRRKVSDVPAVFQIGLATNQGVVLAILGDERKLKLAQWDSLRPWVDSKPGTEVSHAPSWRLVEDLGECHLFAHSEDGATLCVATAKAVHLMQFNPASGNYSRRKLVNTSEPCSCIHFTPLTILIGTDTFYEIDAKDYSIEAFLDPTDTSLSFLMYGATQLRSFPVSILQLAPPEYNPEYLLCFHELGVFVDEDGRRTREDDLKWKRLPLAFAYKAPYLFIGHFNAIEILEIKPRGSKESGLHRTVLVSQPRFLGLSRFLGSMYVASFKPGQVQVLSVNAKCEPSTTKATENGEGKQNDELEFSFTSSVVEMLDD